MALTISEAFELYRLEYIVYRNQSSKTEEMSRGAMNSLIGFTGDIPVASLTFDMVRKWKENLEKTRGQNTVRGYVIKLRVVLKHLRLRGYNDVLNPEMVGLPKRKQKVVDFLTPDEVNRLLEAARERLSGYSPLLRSRNYAIMCLLYASGIRVSEFCALDRTSLRYEDGSFTVIGKGDKARLCFFDERTAAAIKDYLSRRDDTNPALFICEKTGTRITKGIVQLVFRHVSKRAGFDKPVHPHLLRHSFATNLLRNNTNLLYVSKFLGHTSVQTTEMYTHVIDEDLRAIYKTKHTV